jgi:hypothetical protein
MSPHKLYQDMKMDQEEVSLMDTLTLESRMEPREMMKTEKVQKMELGLQVDISKMLLVNRSSERK